jgi:hypothetical protein
MMQKLFLGDVIKAFFQKLIQRPDYYAIKHYEKARRKSTFIRY